MNILHKVYSDEDNHHCFVVVRNDETSQTILPRKIAQFHPGEARSIPRWGSGGQYLAVEKLFEGESAASERVLFDKAPFFGTFFWRSKKRYRSIFNQKRFYTKNILLPPQYKPQKTKKTPFTNKRIKIKE